MNLLERLSGKGKAKKKGKKKRTDKHLSKKRFSKPSEKIRGLRSRG
jgi:hypothetical protein